MLNIVIHNIYYKMNYNSRYNSVDYYGNPYYDAYDDIIKLKRSKYNKIIDALEYYIDKEKYDFKYEYLHKKPNDEITENRKNIDELNSKITEYCNRITEYCNKINEYDKRINEYISITYRLNNEINEYKQKLELKTSNNIIKLFDKCCDEIDDSNNPCSICLENKRNVLLLPCKHVSNCIKCSDKLNECPLCRTKIEKMISIFN